MSSRISSLLASLALLLSFNAAAQARFETPDAALAHYIKAVNEHSLSGINATFLEPVTAFNFTSPRPIESFTVVKRIPYTEKHVREWKRQGIGPVAVGDVELHVREIIGGRPYMFSYNFRNTSAGWKITTFGAWDE